MAAGLECKDWQGKPGFVPVIRWVPAHDWQQLPSWLPCSLHLWHVLADKSLWWFRFWYKLHFDLWFIWTEVRAYLASSSASVVPPHYILVVFILFGQVVKEHALCNRLRHKHTHKHWFVESLPLKKKKKNDKWHITCTFLSRKDAIRPKFFGCWINLKWLKIEIEKKRTSSSWITSQKNNERLSKRGPVLTLEKKAMI